jgi:hypothetical protein
MATDPVVAQLRPDEVQEITTAFMEFDSHRNGVITAQEMKECLRRSDIQFQDAEVDRVISNMDSNKDGTVTYDEYMKFMARVYTGQNNQFQRGNSVGPNQGYNQNQNQPPYNNQNQNQPPYNQNQNQPPYNQNQNQSSYNQNQNRPPYNQNQNQPPYNQNQNQPQYNQNQNQPPYNQNQNQNQPPYNQNQNQPPYNQNQSQS